MNNERGVKPPRKNHPSPQKLACEQALSDKRNNIKTLRRGCSQATRKLIAGFTCIYSANN